MEAKHLALAAVLLVVFTHSIAAALAQDTLFVSVGRACYKEGIAVSVRAAMGPADGGKAYLYSMNSPRTLVSEITLDSQGKGTFGPKPKGKYEIIAVFGPFRGGSGAFEARDCYNAAPLNPPQAPAKPSLTPLSGMTQYYENGMSRSFELVEQDGIAATRVTLRLVSQYHLEGKVIEENIPPEIANRVRMVGFESAYPNYISPDAPIALQWQTGKISAGKEVALSYVIDREVTGQMSSLYGAPALVDKLKFTNTSANSTKKQEAPSPRPSTEAALVAPAIPDLPLAAIGLLLAGLVLSSAIYFLLLRKK